MTATETKTPPDKNGGETGSTDHDPAQQFPARVASRLASRLSALGYDFSKIDEFDPLEYGMVRTGESRPVSLATSATTDHSHTDLKPGDLNDGRNAMVGYSPDGVSVELVADGDTARASVLAEFNAEAARELAYALLVAAEEFDRRPTADE